MKIYFGHSRGFDFKKELYEPIRESQLNGKHEIIFPHEDSKEATKEGNLGVEGESISSSLPLNSKELLRTCDLMIAEVSSPATGLGIELGWADNLGVPIICVFKTGAQISGSLKAVTNNFVEYSDEQELIDNLEKTIESIKNIEPSEEG